MSHSKYVSSLSVDCIIFGFDERELKILLIKRAKAPEKDVWALPGGFVGNNENLDKAAQNVLNELTGLSSIFMEQMHTFGDVKRYPLGRVISITYYSLIKVSDYNLKAAENASEAIWHPVSKIPKLAFDHNEMVNIALDKLKTGVKHHPVGFELLPKKFTLTQLQILYESILSMKLDKRNFRKKILSMDLLNPLDEYQRGEAHRAAQLFKFDPLKYEDLKANGMMFEM